MRQFKGLLWGLVFVTATAGAGNIPHTGQYHITGDRASIRAQLASIFVQAGLDYRVPRQYLWRIAERESGFRPEVVNCRVFGKVGERGLMQLHPRYYPADVACEPRRAILEAARILRANYLATGSWAGAIAAYNWGLGNYRSGKPMPASVRQYVQFVMGETK